jgi:hypothetical protein
MITLSQLSSFANRIKDNTDIQHTILVTTESELTKKMQSVRIEQFPVMMIVIPSYDASGVGRDDFRMTANMIIFILKRDRFQGANETTSMADMEETLAIAQKIIEYLINGFNESNDCAFSDGIIPASFHVDPEFNYLGCNGCSLGFQIKN